MYQLLESDVLPENRTIIDEYLGNYRLAILECILRNMSFDDYSALNSLELNNKLHSYTKDEEARMEKNLDDVAYNIDDMDTLSLITGV